MRWLANLFSPPTPEKIAERELQDMRLTLFQAERPWRDDPAVRVLAFTGTGERAFCSGADLKGAKTTTEPGERDSLDHIVEFFTTLRTFPKPVMAVVNGLALAGGMEVVLSCDIVLAAQSARLGDAHSNFGVFPGGGGAAILPRKVPVNVANYLLFTGDTLSAADMRLYGLVNEVVPDTELRDRAQALGEKLAKKPAGAVADEARGIRERRQVHRRRAAPRSARAARPQALLGHPGRPARLRREARAAIQGLLRQTRRQRP